MDEQQAGSQSSEHCGSFTEEDLFDSNAVQQEQAREFRCSSPIIWRKEKEEFQQLSR